MAIQVTSLSPATSSSNAISACASHAGFHAKPTGCSTPISAPACSSSSPIATPKLCAKSKLKDRTCSRALFGTFSRTSQPPRQKPPSMDTFEHHRHTASGPIQAITNWLDSPDHQVDRLKRSPSGPIQGVSDSLQWGQGGLALGNQDDQQRPAADLVSLLSTGRFAEAAGLRRWAARLV